MGELQDFDLESLSKEITKEDTPITPSVTLAEEAELIEKRKNSFYKAGIVGCILFVIISVVLMVFYKYNESFFESGNRYRYRQFYDKGLDIPDMQNYPKINVKADFTDKNNSQFILPLKNIPDKSKINVQNEFIKNKLVITLSDAEQYLPDDIKVISDTRVMNAVGIYRQNTNAVVEIYCNGVYDWELDISEKNIILNFKKFDNINNDAIVVYVPFEEKHIFDVSEFKQRLYMYAEEQNVRLFLTYEQKEFYEPKQVIAFANEIKAKAVLGLDIIWSDTASDCELETVYNSEYFIQDYGSAELAADYTKAIAAQLVVSFNGFKNAEEIDSLIYDATIPAANARITFPESINMKEQNMRKFSERFAHTIEKMISQIMLR